MKIRTEQQNRKWLITTATVIVENLKLRSEGTNLRIRIPRGSTTTNTDGWRVLIGDLGKNQPQLEIWFDLFSGYDERKLSACFWYINKKPISNLIEQVSRDMWPVRQISLDDTVKNKNKKNKTFISLPKSKRIGRSEFNAPIFEDYEDGGSFFGIYDPTRETTEEINFHFCERAVAFFEDVARSLPSVKGTDEQREVYSRHENRQHVVSHLQRERSRLLANDRKVRDKYQCKVCDMRFEDVYGKKLGKNYAEAHHIIPLSQLKGAVKTSIDDLRTVCANCHRMLHRMEGKREDIANLRKIVKRNRDS